MQLKLKFYAHCLHTAIVADPLAVPLATTLQPDSKGLWKRLLIEHLGHDMKGFPISPSSTCSGGHYTKAEDSVFWRITKNAGSVRTQGTSLELKMMRESWLLEIRVTIFRASLIAVSLAGDTVHIPQVVRNRGTDKDRQTSKSWPSQPFLK